MVGTSIENTLAPNQSMNSEATRPLARIDQPDSMHISTTPRGRQVPSKSSSPQKQMSPRRKEFHGRDSQCPLSPSGPFASVCLKGTKKSPPPKLVFESPRLEFEDSQLFPAVDALVEPEQRWNYMSELAGSHQQDGRVLRLRANMTPRSLPLGMPSLAANRVTELHLPSVSRGNRKAGEKNQGSAADADTRLPQWMDAVVQTFHNLQHLYLHVNNDDSEDSKRLRRLYVLYRLPDLISIDGVDVTPTERRLARPLSPNGQRVSHDDWMKQRLAKEEETDAKEDEAKKPKRNTQAWLSEVLDEKKEADEDRTTTMPKHLNVEVDLTGNVTEVALTPQSTKSDQSQVIYETASSVATADCEWAATCGNFFRPDSMRKQWSQSRLRFSSSKRSDPPKAEMDLFDLRTPVKNTDARLTENDHLTVMETRDTSPIMSKTVRSKGSQPPPRLVLDASKTSPDRISCLVIKSVPPTAPPMPESPNVRYPPSRSLSSPFPMQFRSRTSPQRQRPSSPPKRIMPIPQKSAQTPQRVSSMIAGGVSPRCIPPDSPGSRSLGTELQRSTTFTITGLCKPLPMQRTKSTPQRKGKRDLPPPCPGGGRRLLRTLTPRLSKFKKQTARSNSIIDNFESDQDDSEEEDEQKEKDEQTTLVVVGTA